MLLVFVTAIAMNINVIHNTVAEMGHAKIVVLTAIALQVNAVMAHQIVLKDVIQREVLVLGVILRYIHMRVSQII